jgi:Tetracyclin repressor-like, C-terminal domain
MIAMSNLLSPPDFGPVHTGIIEGAQSDQGVAETLAREIIALRAVARRERLLRAYEQGQVRSNVDLDTAVELLYGAIYHRVLLHTRSLDADPVATVLELAFRGLNRAPAPAAPSRKRSSMLNALETTG